MGNILISTIYKSESILNSIIETKPEKIILLVDLEEKREQKESIDFINKFIDTNKLNIEIQKEKIEVFNDTEIIKKIKKIFTSIEERKNIYLDISSSPKTQILNIYFFLGILRIKNIKKIFYLFYNEKERIFCEIPLFDFERLTDKEYSVLLQIEKNVDIKQNQISINIKSKESYVSKIISKLIDCKFLDKAEKLTLTKKAKIYLECFR